MTSIAAYLAGLTGGAPQEGQKANQATATGASGLFADLLVSTDGEANALEGAVSGENVLGLIAEGQIEVVEGQSAEVSGALEGAADPAPSEIAGNTKDLSEILTDGLAQAPGDVEAEIIETGDTGILVAEGDAPTTQIKAETDAPEVVPAQTVQPATVEVEVQVEVEAGLALSATAAGASPDPDAEAEQPFVANEDSKSAPAVSNANPQPQARSEAQPRNRGLENALQRASSRGQQNGLQNALNQAPQARAAGQNQGASGEANIQGGQSASTEAETVRPQIATSPDDEASIRTRQGRADSVTRDVSTFQRIVDAGNGKKVIQINERIGGEAAGTISPPTLTANVSASAASPGPASPNTPHVPVSALAVHIAQQYKNGARRFDIRLDPPELGRIDVRLDVSRDGQVSTHLVVERAETLDLLQRDARQLERALQDAGLDTSKEDMKFSLKDQGLEQGEQENAASDDNENFASERGTADDQAEIPDDAMPPPSRYLATAGLDIRI